MMDQIKKILKGIAGSWGNMTKRKKGIILGSLIGVVIASIILTLIMNRDKGYVLLYEDVSNEETVEILQQLQESSVDYKYENDGTILIPVEQETTLRMQLAQAGHPKTGVNYNIFTENIDFMTTDYEKRTYEIFQLQERLQSSIKTVESIEDVIITISMPEQDDFAWETNTVVPTASVKLTLKKGEELGQEQVDGIIQLVSKSIEGLDEENIAIIDSNGSSLIESEDIKQTNTIKLKLELEKQLAEETVNNVSKVINDVYGKDNVRISAKVKINFDKKISEMLQYNPEGKSEKGVLNTSQKDREITGPGETTGGVAGTESNAELPTYPGVTIKGDDIYFSDSESMNYLVSQLKEQVEYDSGKLEDLTVAVVINDENMDEEEIVKAKELVAFAAGVEITKVSLQGIGFYERGTNLGEPTEEPIEGPIEEGFKITKEAIIIGAIILGVLLIIIIIILLITRKARKKKKALNIESEVDVKTVGEPSMQDIYEKIKVKGNKEQQTLEQIKDFSVNNPEIVSQLIKTWMKGDN